MATTYYVRVFCRDNAGACAPGDGLTPATALASIAAGAAAMMNPGDQVVVGPGTYEEGDISPVRNGVPGRVIAFRADSTGTLTGDAPGAVTLSPPQGTPAGTAGFRVLGRRHILIEGFVIDGFSDPGIQVRNGSGQNSSFVTIRNNIVRNSQKTGVDVVAVGPVEISGNTTIDNLGSGIALRGCLAAAPFCQTGSSGAVVPTLSNNVASMNGSDFGGHGVLVAQARSGIVENNLFFSNRSTGLTLLETEDVAVASNRSYLNGGNGFAVEQAQGDMLQDNTLFDNGTTGLTLSQAEDVVVANNRSYLNGGNGFAVEQAQGGVLQNNVLFSNDSIGLSLLQSEDVIVANNLSYDNAADGFAFGTSGGDSERTRFVNNTAYKNGGWGLRVGSDSAGSNGTVVLNNILQGNTSGGLALSRGASCGFISGFNLNPDGVPLGTKLNAYDKDEAAVFVSPAGPDGILGGEHYADDDFRLGQRRGGAAQNSPGVNGGGGTATEFGLTGSTAEGGAVDMGVVDCGFHYDASPGQTVLVPVPLMPVFVRASGSDANDGLAPERALATIKEAAKMARAGVTVVAGPGRYVGGDIGVGSRSGLATFVADRDGVLTNELPGAVVVDANGADTGFVLLDACQGEVNGFFVTGAKDAAIQVRSGSDDARVHDNVVFGNQRGIDVMGANRVEVFNNLVYLNSTGGLRLTASTGSTARNNTIYGNGADGILVDGGSSGATVVLNVTQDNATSVVVKPDSESGFVGGFNVYAEGFSGNSPRADSDVVADPLLVRPEGRDGVLGGANFRDDDFHLRQEGATVSAAVNIDYSGRNDLAAGTTRSDELPDLGAPDAGFHYPALPLAPRGRPAPQVVYVRAGGTNAADGGSPDSALATLAKALDSVSGEALIVVGPGRYAEKKLAIGAPDRFVSIIGDPSGTLTGDAPGLVLLDGAGGGPDVTGPAFLRGVVLAGGRGTGLRVGRSAADVTLRDAVVCGNRSSGIRSSSDGLHLINTLVFGNGGNGISARLRQALRGARLFNSTVTENLGHGVLLRESASKTAHFLVMNNVVDGNGGSGMMTSRVARGHNLNADGYGGGLGPAPGDLTSDPQFAGGPASPGIGCESLNDFALAAGSPAVDAGTGTAIDFALANRWARVDRAPDVGAVDLGYHYGQSFEVPTRTPTPRGSATATRTSSPRPTGTPVSTPTPTPTTSHTRTPTAIPPTTTFTATASGTPTRTSSLTATSTPSWTLTATASHTATATLTSTPTLTHTPVPTATDTATPLATDTASASPTETPTAAPTATATASETATNEPTPTSTSTPTPTSTSTPVPSATFTQTATATPTRTPTGTETHTQTPSPTHTPTSSVTATLTSSPTLTPTSTPTSTLAPTSTPVPSATSTQTATATATGTPTGTETLTPAPSPTYTPTSIVTPTLTPSPTLTSTPTPTSTPAETATGTSSPTDTSTSTPSETPTQTETPTPSETPTETPSPTQTETPTATP